MKTTIDNKTVYHREGVYDEYVIKDLIKSKAYTKKIKLSKEDRWLDAGANIGVFVVDIADKVKTVYSYEPEAQNYKLMVKNTKPYDNVMLFKSMIVGNLDTERSFYLGRTPMSYSGLIKRGRTEITVPCNNINDIIKTYKIDNIKLDVEGHEYEIIKAISNENWKRIKQLICEFHLNILKDIKTKEKYNEIIKLLKTKFKHHDYKADTKGAWHTTFYFSK